MAFGGSQDEDPRPEKGVETFKQDLFMERDVLTCTMGNFQTNTIPDNHWMKSQYGGEGLRELRDFPCEIPRRLSKWLKGNTQATKIETLEDGTKRWRVCTFKQDSMKANRELCFDFNIPLTETASKIATITQAGLQKNEDGMFLTYTGEPVDASHIEPILNYFWWLWPNKSVEVSSEVRNGTNDSDWHLLFDVMASNKPWDNRRTVRTDYCRAASFLTRNAAKEEAKRLRQEGHNAKIVKGNDCDFGDFHVYATTSIRRQPEHYGQREMQYANNDWMTAMEKELYERLVKGVSLAGGV